MMLNVSRTAACFAAAMLLLVSVRAMAADDREALTGLKEVKVGFDLKEGDGKPLLSRLDIIDETRQSLIQQGIKPHFIIAFRGPATRLVQTDASLIKPEDREMAGKIATKIKHMSASPGISTASSNARWRRESWGPRRKKCFLKSGSSATGSSRSWLIRPKATPISHHDQ